MKPRINIVSPPTTWTRRYNVTRQHAHCRRPWNTRRGILERLNMSCDQALLAPSFKGMNTISDVNTSSAIASGIYIKYQTVLYLGKPRVSFGKFHHNVDTTGIEELTAARR